MDINEILQDARIDDRVKWREMVEAVNVLNGLKKFKQKKEEE